MLKDSKHTHKRPLQLSVNSFAVCITLSQLFAFGSLHVAKKTAHWCPRQQSHGLTQRQLHLHSPQVPVFNASHKLGRVHPKHKRWGDWLQRCLDIISCLSALANCLTAALHHLLTLSPSQAITLPEFGTIKPGLGGSEHAPENSAWASVVPSSLSCNRLYLKLFNLVLFLCYLVFKGDSAPCFLVQYAI